MHCIVAPEKLLLYTFVHSYPVIIQRLSEIMKRGGGGGGGSSPASGRKLLVKLRDLVVLKHSKGNLAVDTYAIWQTSLVSAICIFLYVLS
jgi:hypothetical protein